MIRGKVDAIFIASAAKEPVQSVHEAQAIPGIGLEGDRYFLGIGTFSDKKWPDQELTLVEMETIESLNSEHGMELGIGATRRNIVTQNVRLEELIGKLFRIGGVTLRGVRPCDPCMHLQRLIGKKDLKAALSGKGGLRASILTEGILHVGDTIALLEDSELT